MYPFLQINPPIYIAQIGDTIPINHPGIIVLQNELQGPAGQNSTIHDPLTGILRRADVRYLTAIPIINGNLKEMVVAFMIPGEVWMSGMKGKTSAHRTHGTDHSTISDYKLFQMFFNHKTSVNSSPKPIEEMMIR
ncbi:MAG: hypothetical protein GY808_09435 [Gammaproteobacteria bacterium]|nr:hypothetical protein [Gammaproteobacteria bacterium]